MSDGQQTDQMPDCKSPMKLQHLLLYDAYIQGSFEVKLS